MAKRGRKPYAVKTIDLTIAATPKLMERLKRLVDSEHYGRSEAEVALALVRERIRQLMGGDILRELHDTPPSQRHRQR